MRILEAPGPDLVREREEKGFWRRDLLRDLAGQHDPTRTAVVNEDGSRITYGELVRMADSVATWFHRAGIGRGDVVGVLLPNRAEVVALALALEVLGAVNVPLAPNYRSREIGHILGFTNAKALVLAPDMRGTDFAAIVRELRPKLPSLRVVVSTAPFDDATPWSEVVAGPPGDFPRAGDPNEVFEIAFTSGSTGLPKGVMHTPNSHGWDYRTIAAALGLGSNDVVYMPSTVGHQLGFALGARMPVHLGVPVVFTERWKPNEAIALMARERTTFTCTTPTFLVDVLASPVLADHDVSSMRVWLLAGAVVHDQLIEDAKKKMPNLAIAQVFGMTEVGCALINAPNSGRLNATGKANAGCDVRVVDDEGRTVEEGELQMRGASIFAGYVGQPEVTHASFTSDGWFKSGDRVRRDADGFHYVTGRIKDLIKRGGESISPAEIEEVVLAHPKVVEAAVVGLPDERLGERVCLVVVVAPGADPPTLEELVKHVDAGGLARQKWPERLEIVDAIPKTSIGKMDKAVLRKRYS